MVQRSVLSEDVLQRENEAEAQAGTEANAEVDDALPACLHATLGQRIGMSYDLAEQKEIERVFLAMLRSATRDGGAKRERGEKPPWWRDGTHEAGIFSHLNRWKHGEKKDPDSGIHPLTHLAWRALALAWQETVGKVEPSPAVEMLPPPIRPRAILEANSPFTDRCPVCNRVFTLLARCSGCNRELSQKPPQL